MGELDAIGSQRAVGELAQRRDDATHANSASGRWPIQSSS